jgi:thymidylate kinase
MLFHIEFMGIPGSGKTTLMKNVNSFLNNHGFKSMAFKNASNIALDRSVNGKYYKLIKVVLPSYISKNLFNKKIHQHNLFLRFVTLNPHLVSLVLNSYVERKLSHYEIHHEVKFIYELFSKFQACIDYLDSNEGVIVDEGFTYEPIRFLSPGKVFGEDYIENYLDHIPMPNLVIRLTADHDLCYERIFNRPSGPPRDFDEREKKDVIRLFELCDSYINVIASKLEIRNVTVLNIDTNTDYRVSDEFSEIMINLANHFRKVY